MCDIKDKITKLESLIKGLKGLQSPAVLPSIKQSKPSGIKPVNSKMDKALGIKPNSQKNPIKQAQQIKDTDIKDIKMRQVREHFGINKSTGQWSLESDLQKEEKPAAPNNDLLYHVHEGKYRITKNPISLREINARHGGVKKLEGAGFRLHQVKKS